MTSKNHSDLSSIVRWNSVALALALCACGGGSDVITPPPPPGPGNAPASITIAAGENQTAAPGAAVAIQPAVIVKNNLGNPLAGIKVTFAIESGGGIVSGTTATTGADGRAIAGQWTLGSAAGANTLKASAGTISAVFHATAVGAPLIPLADVNLSTSGGTVIVQKNGDPLNGLTITIPNGSYPSSSHWTISPVGGLSIPLPSSAQLAVPAFRVSNGQGFAAQNLTMRIPIQLLPTRFASPFYYDPATGVFEALPMVGRDNSSITVTIRHFASGLLLRPVTSGVRVDPVPSVQQDFGDILIVVPEVNTTVLDQPQTTGFQVGVDDWEFINNGSFLAPGGHCAGQSISAMWFYYTRRGSIGPLYRRYDRLNNYWLDNPLGYRFASVTQNLINWNVRADQIRQISAAATNTFGVDKLQFYTLALSMMITHQPQYVGLARTGASGGHAVIAYGILAGVMSIADPNFPGEIRRIVFQNGGFQPYPSRPNATAPEEQYDRISSAGVSAILPLSQLDVEWNKLQAGTIGNAEFPAVQLQAMEPDGTWSNVQDPFVTTVRDIRMRWLCSSCVYSNPTAGAVAKQQFVGADDDTGHSLEQFQDGVGVDFRVSQGEHQVGLSLWGAATDPALAGFRWTFVDFKWLTVRSSPFQFSPDPAIAVVGAPVNFVSRPWGTAPAASRYVWTFNDGTTTPVTVLNDSTVTHTFPNAGVFTIRVDLYNNSTGKLYARAEGTANIGGAAATWRTTTLTNTQLVGSTTVRSALEAFPNTFYGNDRVYLSTIGTSPQFGFIIQHPGGTVTGLGTQPASLWIMFRGDGQSTLSGSNLPRLLARPPVSGLPSPPSPNHEFTVVGTLSSGTFVGNYSEDFTLSNGTKACVRSEVAASKNGTTLSGSFTRYYRLTQCTVAATPGSEWGIVYTFSGTRLP